jgi:hypothetical protein
VHSYRPVATSGAGRNRVPGRRVQPEGRDRTGGDMVVGGAVVADTFRRLGLIDEFRSYVQPVLLGAGRRLFEPADAPDRLHLIETHTFGNGVVMLRYERTRGPGLTAPGGTAAARRGSGNRPRRLRPPS